MTSSAPRIIIIGSAGEEKYRAVKMACQMRSITAELVRVAAPSHVAEQPVGLPEMLRGARHRAQAARMLHPGHFCIGMESGLLPLPETDDALDVTVVVLTAPDGSEKIALSRSIFFPGVYVQEARARGFLSTTVGSVIAEKLGGDPRNVYGSLTNGREQRSAVIAEAVAQVL